MEDRDDLAEHLMADMPEDERKHFITVIAQGQVDFLREHASDALVPDQRGVVVDLTDTDESRVSE